MFLNPIHADFKNPILWEAEGNVEKNDHGLKVGVKRLTTIRQIPLPDVSDEQRIKFGILCAKRVCKDKKWNSWADNWLSGQDRSTAAAAAAAAYAAFAAIAAAAAAFAAAAADADAAHAPIDLVAIAQCAIQEENKS